MFDPDEYIISYTGQFNLGFSVFSRFQIGPLGILIWKDLKETLDTPWALAASRDLNVDEKKQHRDFLILSM